MKHHGKCAKLMALCLALLLAVGMFGTTAFAAGITEDTGEITVTGAESGLTVTAYKLANVNYDYATQQPVAPEYKWESGIQSWIATYYAAYTDDGAVTKAFSEAGASDLAGFYDALAAAIRGGTVTLTAASETTDDNGAATLSGLAMGNYLVLIENGMKVYRPSAVSLVPVWSDDNNWQMTDATVELKSSELTLEKTVNEDVNDGHTPDTSDNAGMGDTVSFDLRSALPNYPAAATAKGYAVSDKLPAGLTLDAGSIVVYGVKGTDETKLDAGTHYTLSENAANQSGETVSFMVEFDYEEVAGYESVHIEYSAVLNEKAAVGSAGNANAAYLEYNNNPYNANTWKSLPADVMVYTYGIEATKVDGETKAGLSGAEFVLSTTEEETGAISFAGTDGAYNRALTGTTTTTLVTGADGKLVLTGLDAGTYYLIETKAPAGGYVKPSQPVEIKIEDADFNGSVTVSGTDKADGMVPLTIENHKGFTLPTTGGMGTILFTAGGVLLMGAAMILVVVIRRRRASAEQ